MTPLPIEVRPAVAADLDAIRALERACLNAPHWPLNVYVSILDGNAEHAGESTASPRRCLFVAYRDSLLVGFAVGLVHPDAVSQSNASTAELESVVVASAARRAGVGRALCTAVLHWAGERGATEILLEVRASGIAAIALYTSLGFTKIGRRPRYYRDPADDAVLMRLPRVAGN
jgi:ribosomal-protein-alanine N-acetyltransferase